MYQQTQQGNTKLTRNQKNKLRQKRSKQFKKLAAAQAGQVGVFGAAKLNACCRWRAAMPGINLLLLAGLPRCFKGA